MGAAILLRGLSGCAGAPGSQRRQWPLAVASNGKGLVVVAMVGTRDTASGERVKLRPVHANHPTGRFPSRCKASFSIEDGGSLEPSAFFQK
ncbi:hypothetical protein AV530_001365 [Patagioenas fasciata monilis]|uniref:Uncharacterized protein n=1 Tax=Patagioenas fasciata monilis TaxID=372326 RepID=A0A1V4JQT1_PATFA|nr:hypothetical protein AV530_001365 [Patagioenas fasciata monilis]